MRALVLQPLPFRAAGQQALKPRHTIRAPRPSTKILALFSIGQKATTGKGEQKKSEVPFFV